MGVYIKDAKMPNSCVECKTNRINIVCEKWENIVGDISFRRADDCPLIEIPEPHGRIIDESKTTVVYGQALETYFDGYTSKTYNLSYTDAPTIIEAEGDE